MAKSFFNTGLLGAAGASAPSDDQFNRVSFLSHFEGSNNGVNNAFDDGSDSNHTITANGNVTQGSFGPFARPDGEWGVRFPQNHPHYIDIPSSSDFAIASDADYTFEFFVFYDTKDSDHIIMDYRTGGANGTFPVLGIAGDLNYDNSDGSADTGKVSFNPHSGTLSTVKSASTLTFGAWNHVAIVRNSGTINFYINGTRDNNSYTNNTTVATAANIRFGDLALNSDAGADGNNSYYPGLQFSGVLSNFRFVNGTAVYSGSSITVPTSKLTAITNTKLLLFQSNRFVDNSPSGHTVPVSAGSPAVTAFGPFLTSSVYDPAVNGASVYIAAGDSDYLSMPAQTIPTGNFTVEGWYYLDGTQSNSTIIAQGSSGNAARTFVGIEAVGGVQSLRFQMGSSLVTPNFAAIPNQWTHFCATYNGSAMELFQNGVSGGTTSRSGDAENVAMVIGRLNTNWANSYGVKGYISNIRVSSVVRQSSNFTPPTAPLTNVDSNVKFLANMADGQAIDSAAQNNLTLYGNAKISTGQAKFGNTSLYLDGSDDYLVVNNHKAYGTGPFTIEMFFRLDSVSGSRCLYDDRPDGASGDYISLIIASGAVNFYVGTTLKVDAGSISANTFYHIALCRSGTDTKLFLDGTQIGSTFSSDTTNYLNTGILRVGTNRGYNNDLAGYIDDFRISHMARYTSNFTAPSEPFADKGQ